MDSAAEGRPLAIFGRLRSSLFASRIRFWHPFCTFLGYVGRRILCAGACPRLVFLCLGSTPESVFYAQPRVPGVLFSNLDFCRNAMAVTNAIESAFFGILGGTFTLTVYRYLRVPGWFFCGSFLMVSAGWLAGWLAGLADRLTWLAGWSAGSVIVLVAGRLAGDVFFW